MERRWVEVVGGPYAGCAGEVVSIDSGTGIVRISLEKNLFDECPHSGPVEVPIECLEVQAPLSLGVQPPPRHRAAAAVVAIAA